MLNTFNKSRSQIKLISNKKTRYVYYLIHCGFSCLYRFDGYSMGLRKIYDIYDKYSKYNYIEDDLSTHRIKNGFEFDKDKCGICWDFIRAMQLALYKSSSTIHHCYFTEVHKGNKIIATHTYIIVRDGPFRYWVECAWQKNNLFI